MVWVQHVIQHTPQRLRLKAPALVAICANGPRQQQILRALIDHRGGPWQDLPADTFKDEGTGVRVALITMQA